MSDSTVLEKSWVLDYSMTSSEKNGNEKGNVILASLNTDIKKRVKELRGLDTHTENFIEIVSEGEEGLEFKTPKFSKDFTAFDSEKTFRQTQQWLGHIIEVSKSGFIAKLIDKNVSSGTYEIGEFEMDDVSPDDRSLVSLGAVFYWSLGRLSLNGQIRKDSKIRFQRVIKWTEDEYDKIIDRADDLFKTLRWE